MTYKLTVAYDGKNYCGFQIQDNAHTVEAAFRTAMFQLFGDDYDFMYSSRTDSGVHALGQVVVIDINKEIPEWKIPYAINAHLPDDIVVRNIEAVADDFHPRYHARYKTYRYRIYNHTFMNPLHNDDSHFIHKILDVTKMQEAAKLFIGEHDFKAFSSQGSSVKTTVRTIYKADVIQTGDLIEVFITGNGFLYNMVRIMVGALEQVGLGQYEPNYINEIIESKDRSLIKRMAPARGLTLMGIYYDTYKI